MLLNNIIIQSNYFIYFLFKIYIKKINSCDVKVDFSASLLQSSVSHNPLEII